MAPNSRGSILGFNFRGANENRISDEDDVVSKQLFIHLLHSTDSAETAAKPFGSRLLPAAHLAPTMPYSNAKMS
jgi:hypothetical protein